MHTLLAQIARWIPAAGPTAGSDGVAQRLMESAEACAGHDPQQAQQLRSAACAYLRVVR